MLRKEERTEKSCHVEKTTKAINDFKRVKVRQIEGLENNDCKKMWKELKKLSVWSKKDAISDVEANEKKEEVSGE